MGRWVIFGSAVPVRGINSVRARARSATPLKLKCPVTGDIGLGVSRGASGVRGVSRLSVTPKINILLAGGGVTS